jgi:putative endonuclease
MNQGPSVYVYLLCNERRNVLYVGVTANLRERLYLHKKRLIPGFTKKYNVSCLVYLESFPSIEEARERERQIKGKSRAQKNAIIESTNPLWSEVEFPKPVELTDPS